MHELCPHHLVRAIGKKNLRALFQPANADVFGLRPEDSNDFFRARQLGELTEKYGQTHACFTLTGGGFGDGVF